MRHGRAGAHVWVVVDRRIMEPLSLVRAWMWDLHRMGCSVSPEAAHEAERAVLRAQEAGAPEGAGLALAREVLRREGAARTVSRP